MGRAQVILEDWQYDALKSRAEREGTSFSALVREAVVQYLATSVDRKAPGLDDIAGVGSDTTATGRDHDRFLYPAPPRRRRRSGTRPVRG